MKIMNILFAILLLVSVFEPPLVAKCVGEEGSPPVACITSFSPPVAKIVSPPVA